MNTEQISIMVSVALHVVRFELQDKDKPEDEKIGWDESIRQEMATRGIEEHDFPHVRLLADSFLGFAQTIVATKSGKA